MLQSGDQVELVGQWVEDPKYGRQFKAQSFLFDQVLSTEGLTNYLANHPRFKGVGPAKAAALARHFGADFGRVIVDEPEWVAEVGRLPWEIVQVMREEWLKNRDLNVTLTWLAGLGFTHHQSRLIIEALGNSAKALLEQDPFQLVGRVEGFGFKRVDVLARRMGTPKESPNRIRAGLLHVVDEHLQNGHCRVDYLDLIAEAARILFLDRLDSAGLVEGHLDDLLDEGVLSCFSASCRILVARPALLQMETDLWHTFHQHLRSNPHFGQSRADVVPSALNQHQAEAYRQALRYNMTLLCGSAGSGKSFTLNAIAQAYLRRGLSVRLAAPTGKAAKRLEQITGLQAFTLHKLLGFNGSEWSKGRDNPLEGDVVIVDEVSMVDVPLAWRLFDALDLSKTCLVLCGDHNQLPPVGPGNLLRDLIERKPIPTTVLDQVVRQAGVLRENSLALLKGEVRPSVPLAPDGSSPWLVASKFSSAREAQSYLLHLYEDVLVQRLKLDPLEDVQLLSPQYDGDLGVNTLNILLQELFQRVFWDRRVVPVPKNRKPHFYPNDKVIHTRNNYDLDVMNGSIGFISRVGSASTEADGLGRFQLEVDYEGRRVIYDTQSHEDDQLELAYALTVHKAQGSEFPCAIVVVHKDHSFMHHRNLFYTAVTRAQRCVFIVGDAWGMRHCAEVQQVSQRKTFLAVLPTPGGRA